MDELFQMVAKRIGVKEVSPFTAIGIEGNAGQGKSRLISEFLHLSQHFYIYGATSNIHSRSYHIFVSLIKTCIKIMGAPINPTPRRIFELNFGIT